MAETEQEHFHPKVPLIIGCALFMEWLDATAVLTALVSIAESFSEPSVRMNLVVSLYLLAVAIFLPMGSWLAERYGPRRVFIVAIGLFITSSLACALSTNLQQLCASRFLQGAAGSMMLPVGQMILVRWAGKKHLLQAMTFLTLPALLGPAIGPPVGGILVTWLSWHWIFLINIPIGLIGLFFILRWVPNTPGKPSLPLDWRGFLLSSTALACLMAGFEAFGHGLLSVYSSVLLLLTGGAAGALYAIHARRSAAPLIDFSLLRIPTFSVVFWGGFLFRLGSTAIPFLLVLLFQVVFGLSALEAGFLACAGGAGALAIKFLSILLIRRFGYRPVLLSSAVLAAVFSALCTLLTVDTPYLITIALLFMGGVSRSLNMSGMASLGYADISPNHISKASTLTAMSMQLSVSLAVALAALCVNVSLFLRGEQQPAQIDITAAILLGSVICLSACLIFRSLHKGSGTELSQQTGL